METIFLKPRSFSANPGASQEYILNQAKEAIIAALGKPTKAIADAMREKMPSEAYMDTLIMNPSNKDWNKQYNHHPDTTTLITQAGRGGTPTQTTPYGNPFLTPPRGVQKNYGQNPNTAQLTGRRKQPRMTPQKKFKKGASTVTVIRRRGPKIIGAPNLAYELKYRKKLRFARTGQYAF